MAITYPAEPGAILFDTVTGTANEVREKLRSADGEQVIAFTLEHGDKKRTKMLEEAIRTITPLILGLLDLRERQTLDKIIDALVPQAPPAPHLLAEAKMNADARKAVLESADWLTAAQLSEVAGFNGQNRSTQPNKWKREGRIFAIPMGGIDYYPGYALDPESGYRPVKGLAPILRLFDGEMDEWDTAIWFSSLNSFLAGEMPKDVLLNAPERVLAAAEDEIAGVRHG